MPCGTALEAQSSPAAASAAGVPDRRNPAHLLELAALPFHHRDPFDHLLIAQAVAEGATFLSQDQNTPRYPVQAITCSALVAEQER